MPRRPLIVGLTGGIACGKSTVTRHIRAGGAGTVIDLDELARRVVEPGRTAYNKIVRHFGAEILLPDGSLDREALGKRVFADRASRKAINSATHWPILVDMFLDMLAATRDESVEFIFIDAPLLFEVKLHLLCDAVLVVHVTPDSMVSRLKARDGHSQEEAERRIAAQMPVPAKMARADYLIDNNGAPESTRQRVDACLELLRARAAERSLARTLRHAVLWLVLSIMQLFYSDAAGRSRL